MLKDPVMTELIKSSCFYINCGVRDGLLGQLLLVVGLQDPTVSKKTLYLFYVYGCLPECMSLHHVCSAHRDQERALEPLGLEPLSTAKWLLGIEPRSPGRAASALYC